MIVTSVPVKDCPFDGQRSFLHYESGNEVVNKRWRVKCSACAAASPWFGGSNSWEPSSPRIEKEDREAQKTAIAWWARRVPK